jgi:hypothetical protein
MFNLILCGVSQMSFYLQYRGERMKHFTAEGPLFKSVGIAGQGTSKRRVVLLSMGLFGFVFMTIVVFILRSEGAGQIAYVMVPVFVLSYAFSIMVIGRTMGGGGLTVDTTTGEVRFRNLSSFGFGSTRISRSDIQELVLHSYSCNQGRNTNYRIRLCTASGNFHASGFQFTDLNEAREAGYELASLVSVPLREDL